MLVDLIKLSWSNTVVFIILVLMDTKLIIDKSTVIDKNAINFRRKFMHSQISMFPTHFQGWI